MTDKEIFRKAIVKVKLNGYYNIDTEYFKNTCLWEMIIFSHDFAKAFFGKGLLCNICFTKLKNDEWEYLSSQGDGYCWYHKRDRYDFKLIISWQHHLQQMVLEKEPLRYLEKFL